jgi:hypothetical protein
MSIGVAIGKGAGAGILIKSAEALEHMEKVNTLVRGQDGHAYGRQAEGYGDRAGTAGTK